ncbi:E3 ubiquitin-protein ligase TRIM33-like [Sipha flava]|uniref:E3 ubiquitin-protein ligase TRIM33-like n=1 Tax=Sipha flava TaxID=143950 RepID=A0A8B8FA92_9HEMI|nr:E3 ubiquitin-protein ligase TRIM33-like [Sipha flava]
MALQEEICRELRAMYQCAFCSTISNGKFCLLDCLHFICDKCLLIIPERENSGVECKKCRVITQNCSLLEYPTIIPPGVFQSTTCSVNICNELSKKMCIQCKNLFCISCAKIHLETTNDHVPIIKEKFFKPCSQCYERAVEVYCLDCSVIVCSLCQSIKHRFHQFRIFSNIGEELKSFLKFHQKKFDFSTNYFEQCLYKTHELSQSMEDKRKLAKTQIDKTMLLLHQKINERTLDLKKEVDVFFEEVKKTLDENKKDILESKQKNIYYDKLINIFFNHDNALDVIKTSKPFMSKVDKAKSNFLKIPIDLKSYQFKLELDFEGTLTNGLLAIENVGKINSFVIPQPGHQVCSSIFQREQSDGSTGQVLDCQMSNNSCINDSNESVNNVVNNIVNNVQSNANCYVPPKNCNCCNQWIHAHELFFSCQSCSRIYHNECHIPPLGKETISIIGNECTLCKNLSTYSKRLNEKDLYIDMPIGKSERKILERILLELYCQNVDSDYFRTLPSIKVYRDFYNRIPHPISLNDIKKALTTDNSYTLNRGISDMKRIFSNTMKYYAQSDPQYISAQSLQKFLDSLILKFIPKVSKYYDGVNNY